MARRRTTKTAAAAPAPAADAPKTGGRRGRKTAAAKPAETTPVAETNGEGGKKGNAEALAKAREAKREEREAQEAKQLEQLLARYGEHPAIDDPAEGEESISVVAKDLNITTGKAAFILMKDAVAKGKVPAIGDDNTSDEDLVKLIHAAREEADRYSSWGWLAARSGQPESWIKTNLEAAGLFTPKAENIASVRAAKSKPAPEPETETTAETPKRGGRRRRGNAS